MTQNKKNFLALVKESDDTLLHEIERRVKDRARLKESFMIGIKVLTRLSELKWTQKDLAAALDVSPQQINKIVRGKQNLTLDTLVRLQEVLQIPLLASWYEKKDESQRSFHRSQTIHILPQKFLVQGVYQQSEGRKYEINLTFGEVQHFNLEKHAS